MIAELKEDLCEGEATEFVRCAERSMCVRFSEFVANDEFVICDRQKDDSQS
jgi:hypothetical protein